MSSSNQDISIENTDLLTEISVAYYQDGATQEEISRKFAISRAKVGRMLKQARDEGIVEIVAHVALNLFTNYVNVALDVPVDFPKVALRPRAACRPGQCWASCSVW